MVFRIVGIVPVALFDVSGSVSDFRSHTGQGLCDHAEGGMGYAPKYSQNKKELYTYNNYTQYKRHNIYTYIRISFHTIFYYRKGYK